MNMINIMVSFSDFYIIRFTYTFKDVFKSNRYFIIDYFSSVLNDQYKMIVQKKIRFVSPLIEVGEFLGYLVKNMINNDSFETEEE